MIGKGKAWFLRFFWVLIPVTLQGLIFEVAVIFIVLKFGGDGFDLLETKRTLANIYIAIALISMAVFFIVGLFKSRPIGRPPR